MSGTPTAPLIADATSTACATGLICNGKTTDAGGSNVRLPFALTSTVLAPDAVETCSVQLTWPVASVTAVQLATGTKATSLRMKVTGAPTIGPAGADVLTNVVDNVTSPGAVAGDGDADDD